MNKAVKTTLIVVVSVILLAGSFSGGFLAGHLITLPGESRPEISILPSGEVSSSSSAPAVQSEEVQTLFVPFWEAWDIIHEDFVDQPVDDVALMRGAIKGMLEALGDQHTSYMDPEVFERVNQELLGEYEGIGAYVDTSTEYLTVISPIPSSPAEQVGLRSGDVIIAIDGKDMTGVDPEVVRKQVLGPAGSMITLTIKRGEETPFDVQITRSKITIKSADGKMLENGIAYIQLTTFGEKTNQELIDTLTKLNQENPRGLILDLRNNGGGYLDTAVEVASQFIAKDEVVLYEQYGNGQKRNFTSLGNGLAIDIPMVVLINEGSASASEIVAGALQDYGRAKLVGVVSYGKGSVQVVQPLSNEQGVVRVTVAKWLTPNGRTIHKLGLTPDVFINMTEDDYINERDPQLDVAVETLLAILNGTPIPTSMPTPAATP